MKLLRDRMSYANVTATLALFVALGGTSYAVATLPRDSVGATQLRPNSVGTSEIRRQAVKSSDIANRSIRLRDISVSAQNGLQGAVGPQGPPGPTFSATISSIGTRVKGNATGSQQDGFGVRLIAFSRSMASCVPSATLTTVPGDPVVPGSDARIQASLASDGRIRVNTSNGTSAEPYPFNLIVAC